MENNNDNKTGNDISINTSSQVIPHVPNFCFPTPAQRLANFSQSSTLSTEKLNEYRSASAFIQAIAEEAMMWKQQLPKNFKPAILAVINGGTQINVTGLAQVSFHGIRIEGTLNGAPCSLLAHQSTVQILCFGQELVEKEERRPIGFIWPENEVEV